MLKYIETIKEQNRKNKKKLATLLSISLLFGVFPAQTANAEISDETVNITTSVLEEKDESNFDINTQNETNIEANIENDTFNDNLVDQSDILDDDLNSDAQLDILDDDLNSDAQLDILDDDLDLDLDIQLNMPDNNSNLSNQDNTDNSFDNSLNSNNNFDLDLDLNSFDNLNFEITIEEDNELINQYHESFSDYVTFDQSQYPEIITIHTDKPVAITNKEEVLIANQRIVVTDSTNIYLDGVSIFSDFKTGSIFEVTNDTIITVNSDTFNQFEIADNNTVMQTISGLENITFAGDGELTIFYHTYFEDMYIPIADEYPNISLYAIGTEIDVNLEEESLLLGPQTATNFSVSLLADVGGASTDHLYGTDFDITVTLTEAGSEPLTNSSENITDYVKFYSALNTLYIGVDETKASDVESVTISNKTGVTQSNQYIDIKYIENIEFKGVHLQRPNTVSDSMIKVYKDTTITLSKGNIKYDIGDNKTHFDNSIYLSSTGTINPIITGAGYITFKTDDSADMALFYSTYDNSSTNYKDDSRIVTTYELARPADFGGSAYMGIIDSYHESGGTEANPNKYYPYDFMAEDFSYDTSTKTLTITSNRRFIIKYATYFNKIIVAENCHPEIYFYNSKYSFSFSSKTDEPIIKLENGANLDIYFNQDVTFTSTTNTSTKNYVSVIDGDSTNNVTFKALADDIVFKCITTKAISDSGIVVEVDDSTTLEYEYIYPLACPFIITMLEVDNVPDDAFTYTTTYPNGSGYAVNTFTINTSNKFKLSLVSSVSYMGDAVKLSMVVGDGIEANMILDNIWLSSPKTTYVPMLDLRGTGSFANIELVGTNIFYTPYDYTFGGAIDTNNHHWFAPILHNKNKDGYFQDTNHYDYISHNIEFSGAGTLALYTNERNDPNETDDSGYTFQQSFEGIVGSDLLSFYHLIRDTSNIPYTITFANGGDFTSDRLKIINSTTGEFEIITDEAVTISSGSSMMNSPFSINAPDGKTANVTLQNFYLHGDYTNGTPDHVITINSPTNLTIGSNNRFHIPDVGDDGKSLIKANANVEVKGSGSLMNFTPSGVPIIEADSGITITNTGTGTLTEYVYSDDVDVQASDFSVLGTTSYTNSHKDWNNILTREPTDLLHVEPDNFVFDEAEELLTIHTVEPVLVFNRSKNYNAGDKTTNRLAVGSGLTSTANITIGGLYIYTDEIFKTSDSIDNTKPLIEIYSDAKVTIMDNTSNILQVPYNSEDTSTTPTIYIDDVADLTVAESSSGILEIYARPKGLTISKEFNRTNSNNNTLILKEISVSYTLATSIPEDGDYTFDGEKLIIRTSKPLTISNKTLGGNANVYISVQNLPAGETANITLDNLNIISRGASNGILNLVSDTDLYLKGDSNLSYYYASTDLPVVRIGANSGVHVNVYETTDVGGGSLTVAGQKQNAAIALWEKDSLTLNSGTITATAGSTGAAIGNYNTTRHGTITVKGGILDVKNEVNAAAVGSRYNSGPIIIEGGVVNARRYSSSLALTSALLGSAGSISDTSSSHATFDLQNSAIVRCYDYKYSQSSTYNLDTTFIRDKSNINNWNGILATVINNYDALISNPTNTTTKATYTIFGKTQLDFDLVIKAGEIAQFYTDNIDIDFNGFENGIQDSSDTTHYSNLSVSPGKTFTNYGTIRMDGYFDTNPHMSIIPAGNGTIEIPLTDNLIQFIPSQTGQEGAYRGNSIFDYFLFQENGESLVGKVDIVINGTTNAGDVVVNQKDYKIPAPGTYTITMTPAESATYSTSDTNTVSYTGEVVREFTVESGKLENSTITHKDFYYTGSVYTSDELLEDLTVYLGTLKLKGENDVDNATDPDYTASISESSTNLTNSGFVEIIVESDSHDTQANFTGNKTFEIPIMPRSLYDPGIEVTGIEDLTFDGYVPTSAFDDFKVSYNRHDGTPAEELTLSDDYTLAYKVPSINGIIGEGSVTITGLRDYDSNTNKFSGTGDFTNKITKTYHIRGDLSTKKTNSNNSDKAIVIAELTDKASTLSDKTTKGLKIGIAGRPLDIEDSIKVTFDAGRPNTAQGSGALVSIQELEYGVDYTIDYEFDNDKKLNVIITGKGNYVNSHTMKDVPYEFDSELLLIDENEVYFKPDNKVDAELIPLQARDDVTSAYDYLDYGKDYDIKIDYDENNTEIINITLSVYIGGSLGTTETFKFELKPVPAGSGDGGDTKTDFSKGIIHLVDTVYARPDNYLTEERIAEDLVLEINGDGDTKTTLAKDTDYDISVDKSNNGVTVTGKGTYYIAGDEGNTITFGIVTSEAGTGTGNNVSKGIIDEIDTITIPGIATTDEGILDEIRSYINLSMHGNETPLFYGEHFKIENSDIKVQRNNGAVSSDIVELNVTGIGALDDETKFFEVQLKSSESFIDTEFLFFKPDYELNLDDIILYDLDGASRVLQKNVDYTKMEEVWYDSNSDGIKDFIAVDVYFTDTYAKDVGITADNNIVRFGANAGDAGKGDTINHGLISPIETVYRRPDGLLYPEDIILNTLKFSQSLEYNVDYTILSITARSSTEINDYSHPSGDTSIEAPTHTVTVQGTSSDPTSPYYGTITFGIVVKDAGEGTEKDFSKGILCEVTPVYARPDGIVYFEDDLVLKVTNNPTYTKLVKDIDYEIVDWNGATGFVTVEGKGSYKGTVTFKYSTGSAGSTVSTNDLRDGSIYQMTIISEEQYNATTIDDVIKEGIKENILINKGSGTAEKLEYNTSYDFDKIEEIQYTTNELSTYSLSDTTSDDDNTEQTVMVISDSSSSTYSNSARRRVYLDGKGAFNNTNTNFIVEVILDQNRIDITSGTLGDDGRNVYQRPDGVFNWIDDLKLSITISGTTYLMNYPTDFYFTLTDESQSLYTINGVGAYSGIQYDVNLISIPYGNPNSYSFKEGIIDYVLTQDNILEVLSDGSINLSDLNLTVYGGTSLSSDQYTITEINKSQMTAFPSLDLTETFGSGYSYRYVEVLALSGDFTDSIQFAIIVKDYKNSSSNEKPESPSTDDYNNSNNSDENSDSNSDENLNDNNPSNTNTVVASSSIDNETNEKTNDTDILNTDEWLNPFIDVFKDNWFYEDVKNVYINNIMHGMSENIFAPTENTTRAMMVQILYNLEGSPFVAFDNPFLDVFENDWFSNAVCWAKENEIVAGLTDDIFAPQQDITREQLVSILHRYAVYKNMDSGALETIDSFVDYIDISDYAFTPMKWAVGNNLIYGNDNKLLPKDFATRSEICAIINRYITKFSSQ